MCQTHAEPDQTVADGVALVRLAQGEPQHRSDQALRAMFTGGAVAAAFFLANLGPGAEQGPILCPLRRFTGIPCPFCGMSTSFEHTAAGRLGDAFLASPLGPVLFLVFAITAVTLVVLLLRGQRLVIPVDRWSPALAWGAVPVVLFLWGWQLVRIGPF